MAEFLSAERLVAGGPREFTRTLERLLPLLGFSQVVNIDGANDQGGDLLAFFGRELVAIQANAITQTAPKRASGQFMSSLPSSGRPAGGRQCLRFARRPFLPE